MKLAVTAAVALLAAGLSGVSSAEKSMQEMQKKLRYGFIDRSGNFLVEPRFDKAGVFEDGFAWGSVGTEDFRKGFTPREVFRIDSQGRLTPALQPRDKKLVVYRRANGLWKVYLAKGKERSWGFVDEQGETVVPARFRDIEGFADGLARARENDNVGYVNTKGEWVMPPRFRWLDLGKLRGGLAWAKSGAEYGYVDRTGEWVIPPRFKEAGDFSEGLAAVKTAEGLYGFIDAQGKFVISPAYETARGFSEGLAYVRVPGKKEICFIDREGRVALEIPFAGAGDFHEGLAAVTNDSYIVSNRSWGFIDRTGGLVIEPRFISSDLPGPKFSQGVAVVGVKRNQVGCIDKSGKWVVPPVFQRIEEFVDGFAPARTFPKEIREEYFKNILENFAAASD